MTILSSRNSLNNIHIYIYKGLIYIRYILHLFKYIINIKKVNGSKGVYIKKLKNTKNNSKQLLHPPPCFRWNPVCTPHPWTIFHEFGNQALSSVDIVKVPPLTHAFIVNYDFNYFPCKVDPLRFSKSC